MIKNIPTHIAIIMDGNGRWAKAKHKPRTFGHQMGAEVINKIVESAIKNKIKVLSLFAFSCENGNRSKLEINFLMKLLGDKLSDKLISSMNKNHIQFRGTGLRDRLSNKLITQLLLVQTATQRNDGLILNLCFNYGGMQDIYNAAKNFKQQTSMKDFSKLLLTTNLPPVDLLIRTGNEKRISNFLLWQSAYAEIIFEPTFWPSYNVIKFTKNLIEFSNRRRRFGTIS